MKLDRIEKRDRSLAAARQGWRNTVFRDLLASLVVFLVALPLCMGIAMACGMPPAAGLLSGVVGGIVVGTLAGSPLQVSGPAAGLIVVVVELLAPYRGEDGQLDMERALPALGTVVCLAGMMQLVAGGLRFGQWFRAVSPAVVRGMMAGIGVSILATQFHLMLDDETRRGGTLDYLISIPEAVWTGVLPLDGSRHHQAAAVGMLTILVIVAWKEIKWRPLAVLPAALVGVLAAVVLSNSLAWPISYINLSGGLSGAVSLLSFESASQLLREPSIWLSAATVAVVASAETLLSASAVDQMHNGPRTRYDRELAAQGVGNTLCGLLGGLPMTGVIVRSSANVDAGARTRLSTILHGFWLLALVSVFPHALEFIPRAALAAVLVYSGYKLVEPKAIRELWRLGKGEVAIYLATITGIVVEGLLLGVLAGIVLAAIRLLYLFTALQVHLRTSDENRLATLSLRGAATFLRLPKLAAVLEQVPEGAHVEVELHGLSFIDHACHTLLATWATQHEQQGGETSIDWDLLDSRLRQVPHRPTDKPVRESEAA